MIAPSPPSTPSTPLLGDFSRLDLADCVAQLRDMLADPDWQSACPEPERLRQLIERHDAQGEQTPLPLDVALLAAAYGDFCRFRRELAAKLNAPDERALHPSPEEWLQMRLRQYPGAAAAATMYADYHLGGDRFRVS
ncbi:hypothetical protein MBSD_n1836 [Mizugakiibacter sediminis]|uniref:Uncharacterized protein n=1 Tax=Mizugakiibacter sediminis TaxID=1475481 RepID=A0A0K8QNS2_9GAMM|nr:hypothetical protein [Mizugakiibacter sediminis]GAP66528.1 hypothetical protein MBSD_n1836 [Mizugakiibacter sediminis]